MRRSDRRPSGSESCAGCGQVVGTDALESGARDMGAERSDEPMKKGLHGQKATHCVHLGESDARGFVAFCLFFSS